MLASADAATARLANAGAATRGGLDEIGATFPTRLPAAGATATLDAETFGSATELDDAAPPIIADPMRSTSSGAADFVLAAGAAFFFGS